MDDQFFRTDDNIFWMVALNVATGEHQPAPVTALPKKKWAVWQTHFITWWQCQRQCDRMNKNRQHG